MPARKSFLLMAACCCLSLTLYAQTITRLDGSSIGVKALEGQVNRLMKAANVQGLALAIFNRNRAVYQKTFGYSNLDTKQVLRSSTNIYGASFSKAVFAVLVMKLVEEGVLDLDKPLQSYLPKPIWEYQPLTRWHDHYGDLRSDTQYHRLTARQCLSHTGGFPNWRWDEPDQKLRVKFTPGSRYGYSGEGMVYLQVVMEKLLNQSLDSLMQQKVFGPLGMRQSAYRWKPEYEKDFAWGHRANGKLYEKDKDNEPRSASTLETTLADYVRFTEGVLQHKVLSPASTSALFRPQLRIRSLQQHGPLRLRDSTLNDDIQLSTALGWLTLQSPYGPGVFKEGHGDGFQHYTILFPRSGTGIVIMTNSDNGESIFRELLQLAIADTFTPWKWENYLPYNSN